MTNGVEEPCDDATREMLESLGGPPNSQGGGPAGKGENVQTKEKQTGSGSNARSSSDQPPCTSKTNGVERPCDDETRKMLESLGGSFNSQGGGPAGAPSSGLSGRGLSGRGLVQIENKEEQVAGSGNNARSSSDQRPCKSMTNGVEEPCDDATREMLESLGGPPNSQGGGPAGKGENVQTKEKQTGSGSNARSSSDQPPCTSKTNGVERPCDDETRKMLESLGGSFNSQGGGPAGAPSSGLSGRGLSGRGL